MNIKRFLIKNWKRIVIVTSILLSSLLFYSVGWDNFLIIFYIVAIVLPGFIILYYLKNCLYSSLSFYKILHRYSNTIVYWILILSIIFSFCSVYYVDRIVDSNSQFGYYLKNAIIISSSVLSLLSAYFFSRFVKQRVIETNKGKGEIQISKLEKNKKQEKTILREETTYYKEVFENGNGKFFECPNYTTLKKLISDLPFDDNEHFNWLAKGNKKTDKNPDREALAIFLLYFLEGEENVKKTERGNNASIIKLVQSKITINKKNVELESHEFSDARKAIKENTYSDIHIKIRLLLGLTQKVD